MRRFAATFVRSVAWKLGAIVTFAVVAYLVKVFE